MLEILEVNSWPELFDRLTSVPDAGRENWFRGHTSARWGLIPSAWRNDDRITGRLEIAGMAARMQRYLDEIKREFGISLPMLLGEVGQEANVQHLFAYLDAETRLVQEFCEACDDAALPLAGFDRPYFYHQTKHNVLTNSPYYAVGTHFALAQHHGVCTRLLDVTSNALVALYFSACEPLGLSLEDAREGRRRAVIVCVPPDAKTFKADVDAGVDAHVFRVLRNHVRNLAAQDGAFLMMNGCANRFYIDHGCWPTADVLLPNWSFAKISYPDHLAREVLDRLRALGITRQRLMPDYESIAKAIR